MQPPVAPSVERVPTIPTFVPLDEIPRPTAVPYAALDIAPDLWVSFALAPEIEVLDIGIRMQTIVATHDGSVVGRITVFRTTTGAPGSRWSTSYPECAPHLRNRGVGTALYLAAAHWLALTWPEASLSSIGQRKPAALAVWHRLCAAGVGATERSTGHPPYRESSFSMAPVEDLRAAFALCQRSRVAQGPVPAGGPPAEQTLRPLKVPARRRALRP